MIYLRLFFIFFRIGLFSIGGGLATLPFLQDLVDKYQWLTAQELVDMIAISESTPGAIGINTATFVGYEGGGFLGGVITTLGLVSPSIIIIVLIAHYFKRFHETTVVKGAFYGIRPAVTGLIGAVGFEIVKISIINLEEFSFKENILSIINFKEALLFGIVLYLIYKYKKHPIIYLSAAAIIGVVFKF